MFSYDPSNRILKVQKLAEEEVDLGLLEYQKESYQKYLTETIYSDMEYLLQVMRELLQVSQVDAEFRVGDLYCGNYKNEVKKKSPSYYPVYAKFTIDGAVFPNEVEVFRIPAMDEDGILNFNGDRRVLLMQMVAAERVSYAADKQTVSIIKTASFLGGSNMSVQDAEKWRELDNSLLTQPKAPRERDLQDIIPTYFPDISSMDLKDQCTRIIQKYNNYHNLRFHWWYVLIAYGIGVFGWFAPGIMLDLRKKMVRAEEEEDVLQLQTMLAILRYTSLDTMEALYWLARQSRIYQTAIYFAYHEYPSDPELALNRLRDKSSLPEFQQICERLLSTISQVTIREAFSDLESERDQMLSIREMVQNNTIERKRRQCSPISRAPLMAMVFGHVLMPIGVLGYNEVTNMMGQLGVM